MRGVAAGDWDSGMHMDADLELGGGTFDGDDLMGSRLPPLPPGHEAFQPGPGYYAPRPMAVEEPMLSDEAARNFSIALIAIAVAVIFRALRR